MGLLCLVGCAPTTLSPSIIRLHPGELDRTRTMLGVQTGPRLSAPYSATTGSIFHGDRNTFSFPQWSIAYDLDFERAFTPEFSAHFGGQGEFYYPLPAPGYGLYGGLSYLASWEHFSVAPALSLRGATDFGIGVLGGPGTIAGLELTTTFAVKSEDGARLAIVPFASMNRVLTASSDTLSFYTGLAFVLHLDRERSSVQAVGGFGRVITPGERSWTSPIIGVRGGR